MVNYFFKNTRCFFISIFFTLSNLSIMCQADVTAFSVDFRHGMQPAGTGFFIYDDDNGGDNSGFLSAELSFYYSPYIDASFQGLVLSDQGEADFGPGGPEAYQLYEHLTKSGFGGITYFLTANKFTPASTGFNILFVNSSAPNGFAARHGNFDCAASASKGRFGFCSSTNSNGGFAFGGEHSHSEVVLPEGSSAPQESTPQYARFIANDTLGDDRFGYDVEVQGDWLFVSAPYSDTEFKNNSGQVYVYKKNTSGNFVQHTIIKPSDLAANNQFGSSLAVHGDILAIGARNHTVSSFLDGAVYLYQFDEDGNFTLTQKLSAHDNDRVIGLGMSIAMQNDFMVVGAERTITNGVVYAGAAYVFKREEGTWAQVAELNPYSPSLRTYFGYSVAINEQGTHIVVGEPQANDYGVKSGLAHIFKLEGNAWNYHRLLRPQDPRARQFYGYSVALNDKTIAVGAVNDSERASAAGAVYLYDNYPGFWIFSQKLFANDPSTYTYGRFGASLQFYDDMLWVGAETRHSTGALFSHYRQGKDWVEHQVFRDPQSNTMDKFASAFDIGDDFVVVGSREADDAGGLSGAVTIINLSD